MTRNSNRTIRALFQRDIVSLPYVITYWNNLLPNLDWGKIWILPTKYMINNKIKEVSYKLIHKIYPCKTFFLQRFGNCDDTTCSFCLGCPEDVFHLFWSCPFSNDFWVDVCNFICSFIENDFTLCFENILFGFSSFTPSKHKQYYCWVKTEVGGLVLSPPPFKTASPRMHQQNGHRLLMTTGKHLSMEFSVCSQRQRSSTASNIISKASSTQGLLQRRQWSVTIFLTIFLGCYLWKCLSWTCHVC